MSAPAVRRLSLILLALALAGLACATSDLPIDPAPTIASVASLPQATDTPPPTQAEPTERPPTATPADTHTPIPPTTTPAGLVPLSIPNGTFDEDLSEWEITDPVYVTWRAGYARLNASEAPGGAALARDLPVPAHSAVILSFRYRSENVADGDCAIEPRPGDVRTFPADNQWREAQVDYTAEAGTVFQVGVSTYTGDACDWVHVDDFTWLIPAAEGPPPGQVSPTPTLAAIPASFVFTRTFTVSADDLSFPAGQPAALNDGQPSTWASLRNGRGLWQFDLGRNQTVAGFRLLAVRDGDQDTTLLGVEISFDGHNWVTIVTPAGQCGEVPNCLIIEQGEPVDLPFGPLEARYLRLRGGPTNFALAEVEIAIQP